MHTFIRVVLVIGLLIPHLFAQRMQHRTGTAALSADGFTELIANGRMSLPQCRKWIKASVSLDDDAFLELREGVYSLVEVSLGNCIEEYPALTASDLRDAFRAIHRFDAIQLQIATTTVKQLGRDQNACKAELDTTKNALTEMTDKYQGLDSLYKTLHSDYTSMTEARAQQGSAQDQMLSECFSMSQKAFQNGLDAGRKIYSGTGQATECRSEVVGWTLVTKCQ